MGKQKCRFQPPHSLEAVRAPWQPMKQCPMGWNWNETRAERGAEAKAFSLLAPKGMENMEGKENPMMWFRLTVLALL